MKKTFSMKALLVFIIFATVINFSFAGAQEDLIKACKEGDVKAAKAAIEAGANVNNIDAAGVVPLVYCVMWPEVVSLLLEKGADPNLGNNTALYNAVVYYSVDAIKLLLAKGAQVDKGVITPGNDDPGGYKKLLADELAKGKKADKKQIKVLEGLVASAPAPTKETRQSPLEYAIGNSNCVECVKLLLDAGAKTDVRDPLEKGNLIYTLASSAAEPEVRINGWKSVIPTYENNMGFKFPDWFKKLDSTRCGRAEDILMLLLKKNIDVNDTNTTYGYTALGRALFYKKISIANLLLKNGADPKIPCKYFIAAAKSTNIQYPICMAAEVGNLETMKLMIEKGANINQVAKGGSLLTMSNLSGGDGYTPLILAISSGNIDVATFLIEKGADVNIGVEGYTNVRPGNVPNRLKLNCLVEVTKKTPMYFAVELGSLELVKLIGGKMGWKCNKDYTVKVLGGQVTDFAGGYEYKCEFKRTKYTPSEWAWELGFKDIYELLKSNKL